MAIKGSGSPMEAVDEYFDMLIKSRFIEMFGSYEKNALFNDFVVDMIKGPFGSDIKKSLFVPRSKDTYKVYIQGNAIHNDESLGDYYISKEYYDQKMYRFQVHPKDYIITCDGTMGKYIRLSDDIEPGIISASLLKLTVDESMIMPRFFEIQWEKEILPSLLSKVRNGCLCHLPSAKVIDKERVRLPSLEEQKIFVEFVEQVDKSKAVCKQIFQLFDDLVKSRFIELFGTLRNNEKGFKIVTLNEVFPGLTDGTHQTPTYTEDRENGFKFLSSKDVTSGKICWDNIKYIPPELHEELQKRVSPKRGDILLAKNGTTGVCAKVDTDEIFDIYVSLALLRQTGEYNVDYLVAAINSPETKIQFNENLKGIGVPNLHLGEIKKTKILAPPRELQDSFAKFVEQVDKSKFVETVKPDHPAVFQNIHGFPSFGLIST